MDRPQMEGGASDPVGESRAVEAEALALVNLRLAIERQMIGVFGDEHVGDGRLGRQAALDQPRRRRRLDDDVLAGAAGVFGPGVVAEQTNKFASLTFELGPPAPVCGATIASSPSPLCLSRHQTYTKGPAS